MAGTIPSSCTDWHASAKNSRAYARHLKLATKSGRGLRLVARGSAPAGRAGSSERFSHSPSAASRGGPGAQPPASVSRLRETSLAAYPIPWVVERRGGGHAKESWLSDGLGRTVQDAVSLPGGTAATTTTYDGLGWKSFVSAPSNGGGTYYKGWNRRSRRPAAPVAAVRFPQPTNSPLRAPPPSHRLSEPLLSGQT